MSSYCFISALCSISKMSVYYQKHVNLPCFYHISQKNYTIIKIAYVLLVRYKPLFGQN